MPSWLEVSLRSSAVYLALVLMLRLAGKRHAGQLSPHDLVVMVLVSSAVQNAMVGGSTSVLDGLAAAGTLVCLNMALSRLVLHSTRWRPLVAGTPTLLIHNGSVLAENLGR